MRKVIKGYLYDTMKSTIIYTEQEKRLWRTNTNKTFFFVYNTGEIEPTTIEVVREYLGEKDVDIYIKIFGEPEEA